VNDLEPQQTGVISELSREECWSLVQTAPVGRLAWSGPTGPTVIPVNFTVQGDEVHIRTSPYSSFAIESDDSLVAFETDEIHAPTRSGWSVLLRGRAHVDYERTAERVPDVWAPGSRALYVVVTVTEVSGRRIVPGPEHR
jgi:uncharacterized protein